MSGCIEKPCRKFFNYLEPSLKNMLVGSVFGLHHDAQQIRGLSLVEQEDGLQIHVAYYHWAALHPTWSCPSKARSCWKQNGYNKPCGWLAPRSRWSDWEAPEATSSLGSSSAASLAAS